MNGLAGCSMAVQGWHADVYSRGVSDISRILLSVTCSAACEYTLLASMQISADAPSLVLELRGEHGELGESLSTVEAGLGYRVRPCMPYTLQPRSPWM